MGELQGASVAQENPLRAVRRAMVCETRHQIPSPGSYPASLWRKRACSLFPPLGFGGSVRKKFKRFLCREDALCPSQTGYNRSKCMPMSLKDDEVGDVIALA